MNLKNRTTSSEARRLLALREFKVLDSAPEVTLDDLTRLAAQICGTPVALISFVDEHRQWFKAKVGLPEEITETPRDIAFCAHAIQFTETFIIEDALADDAFKHNPLVTGETQVRFYAGAQLSTKGGQNLGTLCVTDKVPRKLSDEQVKGLEILARQVMVNLEYKRVRAQAIGRENFLSSVVGNLPDLVAYIDKDYIYRYANTSYADWFFGMKSEEVIGGNLLDLMEKEYLDYILPHVDGALRGDKQSFEKTFPFLKRRGEEAQTIFARYIPDVDDAGYVRGFYSIVTDVTAQKRAEKRALAQSERVMHALGELKATQMNMVAAAKLASLGEMAAGVAHEINNPLAIIMGKTELIKYQFEMSGDAKNTITKDLDSILNMGKRISQIVSGLKTFSRSADQDPFVLITAGEIIEDTLTLYGPRLSKDGITFTTKCSKDVTLECRPTQISQILMNLLGNSRDEIVDRDEKWIKIEVHDDAGRVGIRVIDSGTGIHPLVLEKIMHPFFTTKDVGSGTGLGLSISKGIAESHQGELRYELHEGHTSFLLILPKKRAPTG